METAKKENRTKIKAVLTEEGAIVEVSEQVNSLKNSGYGTDKNGKLILKPYETLFLVDRKVIEVFDKKDKELDFQDLLQLFKSFDENVWLRYLIYRDLRKRGYVVREGFGFGIDFRVYERGEYGKNPAKYVVFGIVEGRPVQIGKLASTLEKVQSLKKKLILAVVSRRGEIVYYSLSQLALHEVKENAEV